MTSLRIGGLLIAIAMVAGLILPGPFWTVCQALGVLLVSLGIAGYFGEQSSWAEARVLEEFVRPGCSRKEAADTLDGCTTLRSDEWISELSWPPRLADVEETLYCHDARSAVRIEIIDGVLARVKAYPKSYLRTLS